MIINVLPRFRPMVVLETWYDSCGEMGMTLALTDGRYGALGPCGSNNGCCNLQWKACVVTIELTPRGKRVRSVREHVQLCCGLFGLHYLGCFCPGWFWRGI